MQLTTAPLSNEFGGMMNFDLESYFAQIQFLFAFGFGPGVLAATIAGTMLAKPSWSVYLKGYGIGGIIGAFAAAICYPYMLGGGRGFLALGFWPFVVVAAVVYGIGHFYLYELGRKASTQTNTDILWQVPLKITIFVISTISICAAPSISSDLSMEFDWNYGRMVRAIFESPRSLAWDAYGANRWQDVVTNCSRALLTAPGDAELLQMRAIAYYSQGQYQLALADQNTVLHNNSNLDRAFVNRGQTFEAMKDYKNAIADYERAWQVSGRKNSWAKAVEAEMFIKAGNCEKASTCAEDALGADSSNAFALMQHGIANGKLGRHSIAVGDFKKLHALQPQYGEVSELIRQSELAASEGTDHKSSIIQKD